LHLANKALEDWLDDPLPPSYETLRLNYNAAVALLAEALPIVSVGTASVECNLAEIGDAAADHAVRNETQALRIAEAAYAMDSFTAIVQETASSARAVVQTITNAEREASDVMRRAIEAMAAIEACAQEIGRMIR
jgi:methyl-accepting chemotaxis protein